jgi:hypothetical protein
MQKRIFLAILTLSSVASCAQLLTVNAAFEEVDVVVNKTNGVSSLSRQELRMIFMGEKSSWPGGKHITVLMLERGQPERQVILREVYKMNESDYTRYFLQAFYRPRTGCSERPVISGGNEDAFGSESKRHRLPQKGRRGRQREDAAEDTVRHHSVSLER